MGSLRNAEKDVLLGAGSAILIAIAVAANAGALVRVGSLLLRGLPYPQPERLMIVQATSPFVGGRTRVTGPVFTAWQQENGSLEGIAAYRWAKLLAGPENLEEVTGARVSTNFFELLHVRPALGRSFLDVEGERLLSHVAILGDSLWRRRFGADPGIVGRRVRIDGEEFTVEGVMPRGFWFVSRKVDVFLPMVFDASEEPRFEAFARLKPGFNYLEASMDLRLISWRNKMYEATGVRVRPFRDDLMRDLVLPFALLAVGFFALVVGAVFRALRRPPRHAREEARFWLALPVKGGLALLGLGCFWAMLFDPDRQPTMGPVSIFWALAAFWLFLMVCSAVMWWSFHDHNRRCRVCLRRLRMPVPTGSYTSPLLELPPGTEYICPYGHGKLLLRDAGTADTEPQWTYYGTLWEELVTSDSGAEPRV